MNHEVPSCGYLLPVEPHDFADAPPDTIAHDRAAQSTLDAEAEAALRQVVRFHENSEVGTRAALAGAVHGIELRLAHQPRFARILLPGFIRA
jgi:hypothetical protein